MAATLSSCAAAQHEPVLDRFEATLGRHASATSAMEEWCRAEHISDNPDIRAVKDPEAQLAATPAVRETLQVGPEERLGYRHVRLTCGDRVLSVAHNWYVPARLTAEMNRTLDGSEAPFGKVVAPLRYTREERPARRGRDKACPGGTVLTKGAVLRLPDGTPISLVVECYTWESCLLSEHGDRAHRCAAARPCRSHR